MTNIPEIIKNPDNPLFDFKEAEIYSFKEVYELISMEKFSYSLFAVWNGIIINIQRRIEAFGIQFFLNSIENSQQYNIQGNKLKDRWLNVNQDEIIEYAQKINIIDKVTHNLIKAIDFLKTNEENQTITKEEIYAFLFLLEKNLFQKPFKEDKRDETSQTERREVLRGGRRRDDKEEIVKTNNTISTTHQELLLKSGVKQFTDNSNTKDKDGKLLNAYI